LKWPLCATGGPPNQVPFGGACASPKSPAALKVVPSHSAPSHLWKRAKDRRISSFGTFGFLHARRSVVMIPTRKARCDDGRARHRHKNSAEGTALATNVGGFWIVIVTCSCLECGASVWIITRPVCLPPRPGRAIHTTGDTPAAHRSAVCPTTVADQ